MPKKDEIERTSLIEKKYTKGQNKKDNEIGQYLEYHDQTSQQTVICQEKLFNDRASLLKEIEKIKKKILNKNEYFLNTLDYSVKVQKNWCSTMYLLKIFMEKPKINLKNEIQKHNGQGLPMQQLTHLFYQLVYSNSNLQQNNLTHGNITPESIFAQDKNQFKLSQGVFQGLSPERINMQKILLNEPIYLSPKIYESFKKRMYQYLNHDQSKSDVFSVGLIVLEAGLGQSIQNIYFTSQVDETVLEKLLQQFENKFHDNPLLSSSVRKMLEIDEKQRPNFISLKSAIPDYKIIKRFFQENQDQNYENEQPSYQQQSIRKNSQKHLQSQNKKNYNKIQKSVSKQNNQQSQSRQQNNVSNRSISKQVSQKSIKNQPNQYDNKYNNTQHQLSSKKLDHFDFFDVYNKKNNNQFSGNSTREEPTKDNIAKKQHKQTIDNFFDIQPKTIPFKSKQNHQINNYQLSRKIPKVYNHYQPQYKPQKSPHYYNKQRPISQNQHQVYNKSQTYNYRPNSQHQYVQNAQRHQQMQKQKTVAEKNFFDL